MAVNPDNTCHVELVECTDKKEFEGTEGERELVSYEGVVQQYVESMRNKTLNSFVKEIAR